MQNYINPYPYPNQYQQNPYQVPQMNQVPQQNQIQDGGFLSVPSEDIVRTYPVAPGKCVTFKIEGKPIVMEKSMGFSQLESPRIDVYELVKREPVKEPQKPEIEPEQIRPEDSAIKELKSQIEAIWTEINGLKSTKKPSAKKKEAEDDSE